MRKQPTTRREVLRSALGGILASGLPSRLEAAERKGRMLELKARHREEGPDGHWSAREKALQWAPAQTAVIICDMWDHHWCKGAERRVGELAPHVDRFVAAARDRGVLIVHSPSACMGAYQGHPARDRARTAPRAADTPLQIDEWCKSIPSEEKGKYPIDQSDGGCDDAPTCPQGSPWGHQIAAIGIRDEDAISDSGTEVWNLFAQRGISNVLVLGVHLNMCVLGRPFGLRNMARHGKNALLVRDLTDTMYNSRAWPHVDHFRGTDLMVEHVEKFVCPSISSDQLVGGGPFRFREDAG